MDFNFPTTADYAAHDAGKARDEISELRKSFYDLLAILSDAGSAELKAAVKARFGEPRRG